MNFDDYLDDMFELADIEDEENMIIMDEVNFKEKRNVHLRISN